ncbi:MAG: FAD-binding oxidoreductase [Mycobacterium sp.]
MLMDVSEALSSEFRQALADALPDVSQSYSDDEDYGEKRAAWNILTQYRPAGVVQPRSTRDVSTILKIASEYGVEQVSMRSGGHSFEGLSLGGEGGASLVIDMIEMNNITCDSEQHVLHAEGGALLGDVYMQAWEHGQQMIPMGSCVTVGLGGQVQAGGYGHYSRTFGILSDRVIEFELVTADGEIRTVNENVHADLFYALRGSGTGSFGAITKVSLRTNDSPTAVGNFMVRWALKEFDIPDLLKRIQRKCLDAPLSFNPMVMMWLGVLEVSGTILTDDPVERDKVWVDFLEDLPQPTATDFRAQTFIESVRDLGLSQTSAPWYHDLTAVSREGREHLRYMKIKAGFLPAEMPDSFLDDLGALAVTQPDCGVRVQILAMDPDRTPDPDTTSIKVRNFPWLMGMSVWLEASEYDGEEGATAAGVARRPWLTEAYELFYPLCDGGYIGDDDIEEAGNGRDALESYFGNHLPRLQEIKAKYDPRNIFHHPLSIPLPAQTAK